MCFGFIELIGPKEPILPPGGLETPKYIFINNFWINKMIKRQFF